MRIFNASVLLSLLVSAGQRRRTASAWTTTTTTRTPSALVEVVGSVVSKRPTITGTTTPLRRFGGTTANTRLYSTTAEEEEATQTIIEDLVKDATKNLTLKLEPGYVAALTHALTKLEAQIPEPKKVDMLPMLSHFIAEYMAASQTALQKGASPIEVVGPEAAVTRILTGIQYGFTYGLGPNTFKFDVTNQALRGKDPEKENGNTIDFYEFGCSFFRPYMDLEHSVVLGQDNLRRAMEQVEAGENVVFFANHQSEADPQVVSCCLERIGQLRAAEDCIYVAGHKVTTDPLAIPFSMGRNLICIHSKKHINTDPTTKAIKQKQNLRSMNALLRNLKRGGTMLWLAPSGGRDRRDLDTGKVPLAPFDSKTIDMFRLMGQKSKVGTHYYTLAMATYDMCPPPDYVKAGVGEERNIRFTPVGLAVGKELPNTGGLESRHEFCDKAFEQCDRDYHELLKQLGKE